LEEISMELINAFTSAARTAGTYTSTEFSVDGAVGANVWVSITNVTGNLVVKLQQKSPISGGWVDVTGAVTASLTGTGDTVVRVYPGITGAANAAINISLGGGGYRIHAVVTTGPITFASYVETIY
jgi:hypothetical protein